MRPRLFKFVTLLSYSLPMNDRFDPKGPDFPADEQTVLVIDDDPAVRNALSVLLEAAGYRHEAYPSADEYLQSERHAESGCLVCDIRMPGMNGIELQHELIAQGSTLPIIFITGHGDVPMAVEAMQKGAVSFIEKPFGDQELLDSIDIALEKNRAQQIDAQTRNEVGQRLQSLTKREREVLDLVITGRPNKIVAYELGVSQRTIEIHRARVMEKMGARSLAELVRMSLLYAGQLSDT